MAARKNTGICHDCFPDGWPANVFAAGCEHGSFERAKPKPTSTEPVVENPAETPEAAPEE